MCIKYVVFAVLIRQVYLIQVKIEEGILEGEILDNKYGDPYYSFQGIPYAEPPIGDLRFKAPQPIKPWDEVKEAKKEKPICFQYVMYENPNLEPMSEDCLYLNVYSPNITTKQLYPVMVWIHGGGFVTGSGSQYKPNFLIRKGVILVTLNYRLEVLGFLSLGTEDIPGNAGMKDQVAAMRWVKRNIKYFGGDPDNITIFGESAGGASVSFHLISPMTKGLFNRAITQSGTANSWWPNTYKPRDRGIQLARQLGCKSSDDKEIHKCLLAKPVDAFVNSEIFITFAKSVKEERNVYFGVTSEKKIGDNEVFFQGDVHDVMRNGIHEDVQVINGYTEDEGILFFGMGTNYTTIFEQGRQFLEFFVPEPLTQHVALVDQMQIGETMKNYYMGDSTVNEENVDKFIKFLGFDLFVHGALVWQQFVAKYNNNNKIFLYKFTCKSERNVVIYESDAHKLFRHRQVVAHADDLYYFFPMDLDVDMNSETFQMIDRATTLWTNFAKYGNPTPDNSLGVTWQPYTVDGAHYLDLGNKLATGLSPDDEELKVWELMFLIHYRHVLP